MRNMKPSALVDIEKTVISATARINVRIIYIMLVCCIIYITMYLKFFSEGNIDDLAKAVELCGADMYKVMLINKFIYTEETKGREILIPIETITMIKKIPNIYTVKDGRVEKSNDSIGG